MTKKLIWIVVASLVALTNSSPHSRTKHINHKQQSVKELKERPAGDELFADGHQSQVDWNQIARDIIKEFEERDPEIRHGDYSKAKNVILFIGDGMGIPTISAARIYSMQTHERTLSFDSFPVTGLSRTYSASTQTPDSAATATAFLCGEKAIQNVIGVNQDVKFNNCNMSLPNKIESILKKSIRNDKWTGVVTTTRVTHATPAASYAHAAARYWENDMERDLLMLLNRDPDLSKCPDIAAQLMDDEINQQIRVVLGGGRENFYSRETPDPANPDSFGERRDGRNLTDEWIQRKIGSGIEPDRVKYIWNKEGFDNLDPDNTDYLLGLLRRGHLAYELDRNPDSEPSLSELVEKAVRILRRSENGFFLLVEGGRIDTSHHQNRAHKSLGDTVELSEAVRVAQELTSTDDTLIVVSADHSHVVMMSESLQINSDILGLARAPDGSLQRVPDNKPYTTLSYGNGDSFMYHRTDREDGEDFPLVFDREVRARKNLEDDPNIGDKNFQYDSGMTFESETHAGEDVAVFASGPMSRMFTGVYEQSYIAHAMMYASCVGDYIDRIGCNS